MPLILPGNVASATAAVAYSIDNSCRFDGSSAYLQKTFATATDAKLFTVSTWVKRGNLGDAGAIWSGYHNGSNYITLAFKDDDTLRFQNASASVNMHYVTTRVFRDPAAWYHILAIVDTTDGTAGDRQQIWINGVRETSFSTSTAFGVNAVPELGATDKENIVGRDGGDGDYFDGYMAEHFLIDGTAYAATSFGEFDEDSPTIWKPIEVSGLTFGNSGYYLDFADSANLGNDANGGTDLDENGLDATDQATDTPTNNFCVMNPLDNYYNSATFAEGNCKVTTNGSTYAYNTGTVGLSAGLWYWEVKVTTSESSNDNLIGIADKVADATSNYLGEDANAYGLYGYNGDIRNNGSGSSYGDSYSTDVIGVYLDLDNSKLYFAKDGVIMNSGTGVSITAVGSTTHGFYFPALGDWDSTGSMVVEVNFGNPVSALSSAVADANGYGNFEYDPSDGGSASFDGSAKNFLALCTKNLGSDGG